MTIITTITLDEKQARAYAKRIAGSDTAETLAANIVTANAQMWADSDYAALSSELVTKLKSAPQDVLDKVTADLLKITPDPVVEPTPAPVVEATAEPVSVEEPATVKKKKTK